MPRGAILHNYIKNEVLPLNIAMDDLGIRESPDEVVITAYEGSSDFTVEWLQFNSIRKFYCSTDFLSVAVDRKSYHSVSYYASAR